MKLRKSLLIATALAVPATLHAAEFTWTGSTSGAWNPTIAANWNGVTPTLDNTADVIFNGSTPITAYNTWLGDGDRTVRALTFSNIATQLEIRTNNNGTQGRILSHAADSGNATITVNSTVSAPIIIGALAGNAGQSNNGSQLLASNLDIIHNGSALLTMRRPIDESGGARSLSKSGSGTLLISANNTFTGDVTISGGILQIGNAGALGATAGDTFVTAGGTLALNNLKLPAGETVSIIGTGQGGIGALYQSNGSDTTATSIADGLILTGNATVGAASGVRYGVGGNGAATTGLFTLTKVGAGQFDLRGAVTIGDIIVNEGFLQTQASTFSSGYNLTVNSGAEFRLFEIGSVFPRNIFLNNATLNSSGTADFTGDTLTGNITLTGACNVTAGGGDNDVLILSGNITGPGASLTKLGARTARLTGTNTYTGDTTVSIGTLQAAGSFTSNFSVAALATLDGEGVTTGTATFANTANLAFDASTNGTDQFFRAADVIVAGGDVVNVTPKNITGGSNIVVIRDGNGGLNLANFNLVNPGRGNLALGGAGGDSDLLYNPNVANLEWRAFADNNWIANDTFQNFQNLGTASPDSFFANDNVSFVDAATGTVTLGSNIIAGQIVFNNTAGNDVTLVPFAAETLAAASISTAASGTSTLSVPIVGATPITVGEGTLVLNAANTTTGALAVNSGTLQIGNGGTTGSIANSTITNNGNVTVNRTDSVTISTVISGAGTFTQAGSGTTILTGTNNYSGLTTVNAGLLQIGNNAASGSITGDILNNSLVDFNRTTDLTYAGQINGSGKVTKRSSNTLTLTGNNGFSGGLDFANGVLIAGDANIGTGLCTMLGNGNVVNWLLTGGTIDNDITFADGSTGNKVILFAPGATDATLSGTITFADDSTTNSSSRIAPVSGTIVISGKMTGIGTGGFAKRNAGTVVITNNTNDYTGPTNIVDTGTLLVDGNVPGNVYFGQNLDNSGGGVHTGILGGSGLIGGSVTARNNSNIAPGGTSAAGVTTPTAATLTVSGDLDVSLLATGNGIIFMDLDAPAGTNDRINAATATIGTDALGLTDFAFNNLGGLAAGSYTLISTTSGITGTLNPLDITGEIAPGFNGTLSISGGNTLLLTVSAGNAYDTWIATFGLAGPDAAFDFDYDNDGIDNGLEWVLGGNPTIGDTASLYAVTGSAATGLTLTFDREEDSIGVATLTVEYGSTLATWPGSVTIGATSSPADGNGVVVTVNEVPAPDEVTVNIPASNSASGKLFARLKATLP
jgi:autotransporter-associated beta strand protein